MIITDDCLIRRAYSIVASYRDWKHGDAERSKDGYDNLVFFLDLLRREFAAEQSEKEIQHAE